MMARKVYKCDNKKCLNKQITQFTNQDHTCPNCGKKLTQTDKVECIDEVEKVFRCPFCNESIELK